MPFLAGLLVSLAINVATYLLQGILTPRRDIGEGNPQFPTADPDKFLPWIFGTVRLPINVYRNGRVYSDVNLKKRNFFGLSFGMSDVVSRRYYYTLGAWLCHGGLSGFCDVIIDGKYFLSRIPDQLDVSNTSPSTVTDVLGNIWTIWRRIMGTFQLMTGTPIWYNGKQPDGTIIDIYAPTLFGEVVEQGGVQGRIRIYPGDGSHNNPNAVLSSLFIPEDPTYVEPPYPEYAHVVLEDVWLGNSGNPPGVEFVVSRSTAKLSFGNPLIGYANSPFGASQNGFAQGDANPIGTIYEMLVDRKLGIGFPRALIDVASFQTAYTAVNPYEAGEDYGVSGAITEQGAAEDTIKALLAHVDAVLFMHPSTGLLTIRLIREYTGDPMDLPLLDDSNLLGFDWAETVQNDTVNEIVVEFTNLYRNMTKDVVRVQNLASIQRAGRINSEKMSFQWFTRPDIALKAAQRELRVQSSKFGRGNFTANRSAILLTPGQHVRVTSARFGLSNVVCRVGAIDLGILGDGKITGSLMQDRWSSEPSSYMAPPSADPGMPVPVIQPPYVEVNIAADTTASIIYNLLVSDYSNVVTGVEYAIQYGNSAPGAWAAGSGPPYALEVVKSAQSFRAFYRVAYTDINSVTQYVEGEFPQPVAAINMPAPTISYVYSGTDVIITASAPAVASGVLFASAIDAAPSDATVLGGTLDSTVPFQYTTPAPTAGQMLYVGAAATDGTINSAVARLQIPPKPAASATNTAQVLLNGSDPSLPNGRDVNDSSSIEWDFSTANIALANIKNGGVTPAKLAPGATTPDADKAYFGDGSWKVPAVAGGTGTGAVTAYTEKTITTGTLANNGAATVIVTMARTIAIQRIVASAACWVRLYPTLAALNADIARGDTDPSYDGSGESIFDAAPGLGSAGLTLERKRDIVCHNADSPRSGKFYARITNKSGSSAALTITFRYLPFEAEPSTIPPDVTGGGLLYRLNAQLITPAPADGTETLTIANLGSLGGNFTNPSTAGSGPKYKTNRINGFPALYVVMIGGNTRAYSVPNWPATPPTEAHIFLVARPLANSVVMSFGGDNTNPSVLSSTSGGNNTEPSVSTTVHTFTSGVDPSGGLLYHFHGKSGLYEAYVGLTQRFTTATNTVGFGQQLLGGYYFGGFSADVFNGDIGEFRFYSGALSDDDILGIKTQMSLDWGVSL